MPNNQEPLVRAAKAIVLVAFRNGPIEGFHGGLPCPTCSKSPRYSRISDSEMKTITKTAVNRVYTQLRFKTENQADLERLMIFSTLSTRQWDDPEELAFLDL